MDVCRSWGCNDSVNEKFFSILINFHCYMTYNDICTTISYYSQIISIKIIQLSLPDVSYCLDSSGISSRLTSCMCGWESVK